MADLHLPPGLMIAAPRSGAGKTTFTLGLLRALQRRGVNVQPFKCGPDYIDPAFHARACGRESYNVDSWAMPWPLAAQLIGERSAGADIIVAEALMGLFDGVASPGEWGNGASADIAAATGWPVVLVLDVSGQAQTAAATARGFQGFRDGLDVVGVILNRVGSERHRRLVSAAMDHARIPVLGALSRESDLAMPERHLGLVQASETANLDKKLDALADFIEARVDVARLLTLARSRAIGDALPCRIRPPGQRIALAQDAAFTFVYPHVVAGWRSAGAEILSFSPLADEGPDESADVAWLPGGYPELYAGQIAGAHRFKSAIIEFSRTRAVHGECGGYMVLGTGLVDAQGHRHAMTGLLSLETSFAKRALHLGYRRAHLLTPCLLGDVGQVLRGHEFHYSTVVKSEEPSPFELSDADGTPVQASGAIKGRVTGSFFHHIAAI